MAETKKRVFKPRVETKLAREDLRRLDELAKLENVTKSELVREAVLLFLDKREELRNQKQDSETARMIEAMTNRICAMLARQGRWVGTVYELHAINMGGTPQAKAVFEAAANTAKQRMNRSIEKDERDTIAALKKELKA